MVGSVIKKVIFVAIGLLVAAPAFAQDLKCTSEDKSVMVAITTDGGEETMAISKAGSSEKYLVLYHDANKVVAMVDSAISGPSPRGAILSLNTYGKNYLSYNGDLTLLECH